MPLSPEPPWLQRIRANMDLMYTPSCEGLDEPLVVRVQLQGGAQYKGALLEMEVSTSTRVYALKKDIESQTGFPADSIKLTAGSSKGLEDHHTLQEAGLVDGIIVDLVPPSPQHRAPQQGHVSCSLFPQQQLAHTVMKSSSHATATKAPTSKWNCHKCYTIGIQARSCPKCSTRREAEPSSSLMCR